MTQNITVFRHNIEAALRSSQMADDNRQAMTTVMTPKAHAWFISRRSLRDELAQALQVCMDDEPDDEESYE